MPQRWLSVDEIAAHLGVNPDTIYKWIIRNRMSAHQIGRCWKFFVADDERFGNDDNFRPVFRHRKES